MKDCGSVRARFHARSSTVAAVILATLVVFRATCAVPGDGVGGGIDSVRPAEASAEVLNPLACRLSNYQGCEDRGWAHLPSIGIKHIFLNVPSDGEVAAIRERLARHGLTAVVLRGSADLSRPDGVTVLKEQLRICAELGVKSLFLSVKRQGVEKGLIYDRLREGGRQAARYGVVIALETHPDLATNGDVQLETMKQVNHPNVRVNFDTGNIHFYNRGTDAPTELRKIIDYVATVELKDHDGEYQSWHFPALGRGKVDLAGVLRILREHRYRGPVTMEIEGIQGISRSPAEIERDIAESATFVRSVGGFK